MSDRAENNLEDLPKSDKSEETPKNTAIDWEQRKFVLEQKKFIVSAVIGFLGVIVAAAIGFLNLSKQVSKLEDQVSTVGSQVESDKRNVLANRLIIVSPADGESVDSTAIVRGKTPYPERNHYIVVTPIKTNDDWVQKNLIKPDRTGSWAGNAEFGTGEAGAEEKFLVRVLATGFTIPPGQLKAVPPDAIPSESITVIRKK